MVQPRPAPPQTHADPASGAPREERAAPVQPRDGRHGCDAGRVLGPRPKKQSAIKHEH